MVQPPPAPAQHRVAVAGVTDVGRQRKHNEDCLLIRAELGLFAVADGMGGHNAGDVASKLVATSLGNYFEATAQGSPELELPEDYAALTPGARRLAAGVTKANRDVFTISNTHQQHHGMGSTCVAIHVSDGMVHIAHVGDSRCYRIRGGEIQQMTRDHSLINDALDMKPDLTKEELARLPKNIITRALGMKDVVKVDVKSEIIQPGDVFLLCSDGLTGMVPVDQILDVINLTAEPQEACELLVAEANDHGGTDNISALLVRLDDAIAPSAADEIDISAHAELEVVDHEDLDPEQSFELEAPPSSERITYPAAPSALRAPSNPAPPAPPPEAHAIAVVPAVVVAAPPETEPDEPPTIQRKAPPEPPVAIPEPEERPIPLIALAPPAPLVIPGPAMAKVPVLEIVSLTPELEVAEDGAGLDGLISPEEAEALATGGEIDLDLHGPWPGKASVKRCPRCRFELFPGNRFCTECGARIEAPAPVAGEP